MWQFLLFAILNGEYILPRFGMVKFTQYLLILNGDFIRKKWENVTVQKDNEKSIGMNSPKGICQVIARTKCKCNCNVYLEMQK